MSLWFPLSSQSSPGSSQGFCFSSFSIWVSILVSTATMSASSDQRFQRIAATSQSAWTGSTSPLWSLSCLQPYFHRGLLLFNVHFMEKAGCSCYLGRALLLSSCAWLPLPLLWQPETAILLWLCLREREALTDWMQFYLMLPTLSSFSGLATRALPVQFFRPTIWELH